MKLLHLFGILLFLPLLLNATNIDSNITTSQTWTLGGSPYYITGNRTILSGAVVTVEAGVHILFNSNTSLVVGSTSSGGLIVNGFSGNPVVFSANSDTPTPGFWNYLRTASSSSNLVNITYAVFEYGGSTTGNVDVNGGNPQFTNCVFRNSLNYGLYHTSSTASATIQDCSFQNNGVYPLYWNTNQVHNILTGNTFSGNNPNRILLRTQNADTGVTWQNPGIPLEPENDLTIRNNGADALIISPGTQILFRVGKSLDVGYTTSSSDASIAATGVTFGAVDPLVGWSGIEFLNAIQPSSLVNCTIRDVSSAPNGAIYAHNNQLLTISGCLFQDNNNFGLYCGSGANFEVTGCTFTANANTISLAAADVDGLKEGNLYYGNTENRITCRGGAMNESATWTAQSTPILVTVNITGSASVDNLPVIIMPYGTVLEFASGISFSLGYSSSSAYGAVLQATGVTFRGAQSTPGYWVGLNFYRFGGPHLLSGCTIRDAGYNDNPAIQFSCVNTAVTGCTVTNCAAVGINFSDISLTSLSGNVISNCGTYPLSMPANSVRVLGEGNNFSGNTIDMVEVRAQTIDISGIWRNPLVPYYINNDMSIYSPAPFPHLQILPGTVIAMPTGVGIIIGYSSSSIYKGSLAAEGVTFTRSSPTADPDGLYFNTYTVSELCVFKNCVFEYQEHAGQYSAVYVTGCAPTFNGCVFQNNPGYGILTSSSGRPTALDCSFLSNGNYPISTYAAAFDVVSGSGNYFSGNYPDRILIAGGTLAQNYIWDNPGVPVEVSSDINIYSENFPVLKINSGLVLLFRSGAGMLIGFTSSSIYKGGLQADGATFSALSGVAGGWNGLRFVLYLDTSSYLRNCVVEYAGSNGNVWLNNSPLPVIESCVIRYGTYGIRLTSANSSPQIIRNYILNNEYGVFCDTNANPVVGGSLANANCIQGNLYAGVHNGVPSVLVNAEYNWWGDPSGPTHSGNPGGTGDIVTDYVDYDPWRDNNIGDAPARFHLLTPATASVIETFTPVLDWELALDPTPGDIVSYTLYLARNSSFTQDLQVIPTQTATVYHVPDELLDDDTRYYWRVTATDTQDQTTDSYENYFYFDTAVPEAPGAFSLVNPANEQTVHLTSQAYSWQAATDPDPGDVITYTVYTDITAAFENPVIQTTSDTSAYSGFCSPGALYYWRVKAADLQGFATYSQINRFFVHPDARPRPPVAFTLTPMGADMLLEWDAVPGADSYDVYSSASPYSGFTLLQSGQEAESFLHLGGGMGPQRYYYVTSHDTE